MNILNNFPVPPLKAVAIHPCWREKPEQPTAKLIQVYRRDRMYRLSKVDIPPFVNRDKVAVMPRTKFVRGWGS